MLVMTYLQITSFLQLLSSCYHGLVCIILQGSHEVLVGLLQQQSVSTLQRSFLLSIVVRAALKAFSCSFPFSKRHTHFRRLLSLFLQESYAQALCVHLCSFYTLTNFSLGFRNDSRTRLNFKKRLDGNLDASYFLAASLEWFLGTNQPIEGHRGWYNDVSLML